MMNKFLFIFNYIIYYFSSQNKHHIHSPFVFDLVTKVFNQTNKREDFQMIENLRKRLERDKTIIAVEDFGAGADGKNKLQRSVGEIAMHAAMPLKYGSLLYRLINYFKPENMMELGTSLAISTAYEASGNKKSKFISLEGCANTAAIAKQNLSQLQLNNVEIIIGNFDNTFSQALQKFETIDYVFFDGNHKKIPTMKYFNECLSKINQHSFFVFDDINWSPEMQQAWTEICANKNVTISIDLFKMGIIFFNKDFSKQHFVIRD